MTNQNSERIDEVKTRLEGAEQKLEHHQKILKATAWSFGLVLFAILIPGVAQVFGLLLFFAVVLCGVLLLIAIMIGYLEKYRPSSRLSESDDSLPRSG